jgi:ABC-type antimicrobial peptide transport system permease subunit
VSALRKAIVEVDAGLPLYDVRTMQQRIDESLIARRSPMILAMGFGLVALFLAGVGIYGVLAYTVAQRTREIGIRMALGSTTERIFRLIAREGFTLLGIGFALGLAGTLSLARYLGSLLFGVRPVDPYVLAMVTGILALAATIACLLPAQRAARVDPVVALRQE